MAPAKRTKGVCEDVIKKGPRKPKPKPQPIKEWVSVPVQPERNKLKEFIEAFSFIALFVLFLFFVISVYYTKKYNERKVYVHAPIPDNNGSCKEYVAQESTLCTDDNPCLATDFCDDEYFEPKEDWIKPVWGPSGDISNDCDFGVEPLLCSPMDYCEMGVCVRDMNDLLFPFKEFEDHPIRGDLRCNSTEPTMLTCKGGCLITSDELSQLVRQDHVKILQDDFLRVPRTMWMVYRGERRDRWSLIQEFITAEYNMFNGACQTPLILEVVAEAREYINQTDFFIFAKDPYARQLFSFLQKYNTGIYGSRTMCLTDGLPLRLLEQKQMIEGIKAQHHNYQQVINEDCIWVK